MPEARECARLLLETIPNLMRNLGGAVGLALIDTVIFSRAAGHGRQIMDRLKAGDLDTALFVGIPRERFLAQAHDPLSPLIAKLL